MPPHPRSTLGSRWALKLAERRGYWKAVVAIAAKNARMAVACRSARKQRMTGIGRRCDMRRDGSLMAGKKKVIY